MARPRSADMTTLKHHYRWIEQALYAMADGVTRRVVSGETLMLAQIELTKGAVVAQHAHHNEQMTYVVAGAMQFWIGADRAYEAVVCAGEVLHVPSRVVHEARALEDTIAIDVFSPPRQEWLQPSTPS